MRILVQSTTGPFFFENKQGEAVTVNDDRYRAMLNEYLFTKTEKEDIGNIFVSSFWSLQPFSQDY